jgi:regulator of sigma D
MGKQHELLAVEGDLQGTAKKVVDEAIQTFSKRADHFQGHIKTLTMFDEARQETEGGVTERKELVSTVDDKLKYVFGHIVNYYDAVLQKESTNQKAVADLTLDGKVIGKDLPATFLLGLETKLKSIRAMLEAIPTLPPGIAWELDATAKGGVYKTTHPITTYKTEKRIQHKVMYEATENHPAQIQAWNEDEKIGKYNTEQSSGMLTTAEKSARLAKVDRLIQAVKKARQRANNIEVVKANIGKTLTDYIMG